jgi:hypothetical protein
MRTLTSLLAALSLVLSPFASAEAQQSAADKNGGQQRSYDLLGGVLTVRALEKTIVQAPRQENIMGSAQDANTETRLRTSIHDTEIVLQASSLKARAPDDLASALSSSGCLTQFKGKVERLERTLSGGGRLVAALPEQDKCWDDSYLLAHALIADPRGFVHEVDIASWYKPERYAEVAAAAKAELLSLEVGAALPTLPSGEVVLETLRKDDLAIRLDGKHFLGMEQGADFAVHRITSVRVLGEPASEIGIYVGDYPRLFAEEKSIAPGDRREVKGRLFDQAMTWLVWNQPGAGKWLMQEAIVKIPGQGGLVTHVFISGPPEDLAELRGIAETLRLRPHS